MVSPVVPKFRASRERESEDQVEELAFSSCSLLGIGPLWPSPFLRWAQCPSSRQLHQTLPVLC